MSEALRLANTYESDPKRKSDWIMKVRSELRRLAGVEAELQQAREERTALLVNEQNLQEELAALRASLGEPVGFASDLDRPSPRFVTDLKFCTIAEHEAGDHIKYIPLYAIKDAMLSASPQAPETKKA
jgi:hypothetical protein